MTALEHIDPGSCIEDVAARTTDEGVLARPALEQIGTGAAEGHHVEARAVLKRLRAGSGATQVIYGANFGDTQVIVAPVEVHIDHGRPAVLLIRDDRGVGAARCRREHDQATGVHDGAAGQ